jgi:hypothetical protein
MKHFALSGIAAVALTGLGISTPAHADDFQDQINKAQKTLGEINALTTRVENRQASARGTSRVRTVTTSSETKVKKADKATSPKTTAKKKKKNP